MRLGSGAAFEATSAGRRCAAVEGFNGAVVNNCGTQVWYQIPIVTGIGGQGFTLATNNPGGGTFTCQIFAQSQTGQLSFGTLVTVPTGVHTSGMSVNVSSGNSVFMNCNINPGGTVYNISQ